MTTIDLNTDDVCHCGDYRTSHPGGVGPCGLCARSRAPYDVCRGFVFAYHDVERGVPVTRRRDTQTPPRDQGAMSDPPRCHDCGGLGHLECDWQRV